MERDSLEVDRLKRIAAAALLSVAVYELVKYRRKGDKIGHTYRLPSSISDTGNFIVGVMSDGRDGVSRISGKILGLNKETGEFNDLEIDASVEVTPAQVEDLEEVYPPGESVDMSD